MWKPFQAIHSALRIIRLGTRHAIGEWHECSKTREENKKRGRIGKRERECEKKKANGHSMRTSK